MIIMNLSNSIHLFLFLFLNWTLLSPHQLNLLSLLELDYTHDDELY